MNIFSKNKNTYIGSTDYVDGNSVFVFVVTMFYSLSRKIDVFTLFNKARELAITISWIAFKSDSTLATMTQELVENGDLKYILFEYEYIHTYIL